MKGVMVIFQADRQESPRYKRTLMPPTARGWQARSFQIGLARGLS
jgi:hypothetical protein